MTTGVDAQTCKLIVLDQTHPVHDRVQADHRPRHPHQRGLRQVLLHHHGFQEGHRAVRRPGLRRRPGADLRARAGDDPPVPPDDEPPATVATAAATASTRAAAAAATTPGEKRIKYVVGGDVTVYVVAERVQYYGPDGKLITESLKDYTRKAVRKEFASLDDFLRRWNERRAASRPSSTNCEAQGVLLRSPGRGSRARTSTPST